MNLGSGDQCCIVDAGLIPLTPSDTLLIFSSRSASNLLRASLAGINILSLVENNEVTRLRSNDFIFELFLRRRQATLSNFVFPADSETGHMMVPRKAMLNVVKLSGVSFTIHDFRRTFITTAESLDISAYALKRLLNHKMNNDVTSGYLIIDVE